MKSIMKHICLLIFMCLMCIDVYGQGFDLTIRQEARGTAQGEWDVTLENASPCVILNAYLDCTGFQSRRDIDPKVILKQGDACIVNDGQRINPSESLRFVYAWEDRFPFKLLNQSVACS
ncbi:hypothetical protein QVD17_30098 [Tagetes erecta]|uniref:Uncharacterized protein n=1 Tax=Tagetes erecta TaxID=13708 RepID=A0AAD8K0X3_TARER|nr:hypothetical protein QVD17_30098 [Tagetes erecta]